MRLNSELQRVLMNDNDIAYAKEQEQDYVWYFYSLTDAAAGSGDWPGEILRIYDEHWDKVKEAIRRDYWHTLADGGVGKPTPDDMMSLHDSNQMLYSNIIYDIDDALLNAKRHDDRVAFARDCLEIFDLRDGRDNLNLMNFQLAVRKKIYPNDPCPCGSGKKYKKCCGKK